MLVCVIVWTIKAIKKTSITKFAEVENNKNANAMKAIARNLAEVRNPLSSLPSRRKAITENRTIALAKLFTWEA